MGKFGKTFGVNVSDSMYFNLKEICVKYDITISDVLFVLVSNWLESCENDLDSFMKEFIENSKIVPISKRVHKRHRFNKVI